MIDIKKLREEPGLFKQAAKNKRVDVEVDKIVLMDKQLLALKQDLDKLREEKKQLAKEKADPAAGKAVKEKIKAKDEEVKNLEPQLQSLISLIPNPTRPDVKIGSDESENEVIRTVNKPKKFDFKINDYMELGESLDVIDVERASKVSGTRFGYIKNELAMLEFAIIQYAWNLIVKNYKFIPFVPPVMISEKSMRAMGYLEHGGEDETYHFKEDDLYLVGTSEQSMGPYHLDEILDESKLPLRYTSFSTCFRREAGAAGKDTRGILRTHQFDKIEMFIFCKPEDSDKEHEMILGIEEELMKGLKLPYQVVRLCSGDLGKPSARTYDIETWLPSQNKYRETHSSSNCTDYQARRLNVRYKDKKLGKNELVHTLNGTAFAIGRILIMILENYQQADGTVLVPEVLQPYCGFERITKK